MTYNTFKYYFLSIFIIFITCTQQTHAVDNNSLDAGINFSSTEPLFVSLGSFCGPSSTLKASGQRKASFPFDWVLSVNGEKIIQILEDNFSHFFEPKYLEPFVNGVLLQKYYQIEFSHEGEFNKTNFHEKIPILFEKYSRRIERFRKLNQYKGPVYFIRGAWPLSVHPNYAFSDPGNLEITEEYSIRLYMALQKFFPALDVHLVIINPKKKDVNESMKIIDKIVFVNRLNVREILKLYKN